MLSLLFSSCSDEKLVSLPPEEIEGVVSYKKESHSIYINSYFLYIQSPIQTVKIEVSPNFYKKHEIGDSISVIIQKYKVYENEKDS